MARRVGSVQRVGKPDARSGEVEKREGCPFLPHLVAVSSLWYSFSMSQLRRSGFMKNWFAVEVSRAILQGRDVAEAN